MLICMLYIIKLLIIIINNNNILIFQPNVRVLNYAPGPLLTDMYKEICTTCGNQEVVEMFNTSKKQVSTKMNNISAHNIVHKDIDEGYFMITARVLSNTSPRGAYLF